MSLKTVLVVIIVLSCCLLLQVSLGAQPPDEKAIKVAIIEDLKKNNKDYGADELIFNIDPTVRIVKIGEYDNKGKYYPVYATLGFGIPKGEAW